MPEGGGDLGAGEDSRVEEEGQMEEGWHMVEEGQVEEVEIPLRP